MKKNYFICVAVLILLSTANNIYSAFSQITFNNTPFYIDNQQYAASYSPGHIIFDKLEDVAIIKMAGDQTQAISDKLNDLNQGISGLNKFPTVFCLDSNLSRITWNTIYWDGSNLNSITFGFKTINGFSRPRGIAVDGKDKLVVADTDNNKLVEFSISNFNDGVGLTKLRDIGLKGDAPGQLNAPMGVCFDRNGNIWVADTGNNRVQAFDSNGNPISGSILSDNFNLLTDVAISYTNDNIYVCDNGRNKILKYDNKLNKVSETTSLSNAYYKLAIDINDNIYATIRSNKIIILSSDLSNSSQENCFENTTGIDICNVKKQNIFTQQYFYSSLGVAAAVSGNQMGLYSLGVTIKNFKIKNEAPDKVWINQNNKLYYPQDNTVSFDITSPGGVYTIQDYLYGLDNLNHLFSSKYEKMVAAGNIQNVGSYSSPNNPISLFNNYIPINSNGNLVDPGLHSIVMNIKDQYGFEDTQMVGLIIDNDTTPPVSNPVTTEAQTSNTIGQLQYLTSQTWFYFNGATDKDDTGATGCGLKKYQYSLDNVNWIDVLVDNPVFRITEAAGPNATVYYRAIDNVDNIESAHTIPNIKIGWEKVADHGGHTAVRLNDEEMWLDGALRFDGSNWTQVFFTAFVNTTYPVVTRFYMADRNTGYGLYTGYGYGSLNQIFKYGARTWTALTTNNYNPLYGNLTDICEYKGSDGVKKTAVISSSGDLFQLANETNSSIDLNLINQIGATSLNRIKMNEDDSKCWIVGNSGFISTSNTDIFTWNTEVSNTTSNLKDIYIFADGSGWAIGDNGTILKRNTTGTWSVYSTTGLSGISLNCIYMKDKNLGWIAADQGNILIWDGNSWKTSTVPDCTDNLYFVIAGKDTVWAGGANSFVKNFYTTYVPVSRPIGLSAKSNVGSISLSWQASTNGSKENVVGYNIYRMLANSDPGFTKIQTAGSATTFTDSGLQPGKKYIYAVTARYTDANNVLGETYYSNEVFANSDGSIFYSAGTDAYPASGDLDSSKIHSVSSNYAYITNFNGKIEYFDGQTWKDMGWNPINGSNISTGFTLVDYDMNSQGLVVAAGNRQLSGDYNEIWDNSNNAWTKINYFDETNFTSHCMVPMGAVAGNFCTENINSVCGTDSDIWVSGSYQDIASNNHKSLLAKYLGSGSWKIYSYPALVAFDNFRITSSTFGFGGYQNQAVVFNGTSFKWIPAWANLNLPDSVYGTSPNLTANNCTIQTMGSVYFISENLGWSEVVMMRYYGGGSTQYYNVGIAKWNGTNWSIEYISPITYTYDDWMNDNQHLSGVVSAISIESATKGIAVLKSVKQDGSDKGTILTYDGTTWNALNTPADINYYKVDTRTNAKSWISGSSGQLFTIRDDVPAGTVSAPNNIVVTATNGSKNATLTWNASSATNGVKGYNVLRKFNTGDYMFVGNVPAGTSPAFTDNGFITANGNYSYEINAYDIYGNESSFVQSSSVTLTGMFTCTPTLTPAVTNTFTYTPTPSESVIYASAWPQEGYDVEHTNKSPYVGYLSQTGSDFNLVYNFYAPSQNMSMVADSVGNIYLMAKENSFYTNIYKISESGDINVVGGGQSLGDMKFAMGKNNHLYYSIYNPSGDIYSCMYALNTQTGNIDAALTGAPYINDISVDQNGILYIAYSGGLLKINDDTTTMDRMWSADKSVGSVLNGVASGHGSVVDNAGNIYSLEFTGAGTGNFLTSGLKIVKYDSNGNKIIEQVISNATASDFDYNSVTGLSLDEANSLIYAGAYDRSSDIFKYLVFDESLNLKDTINTGIHPSPDMVNDFPQGMAVDSKRNMLFFNTDVTTADATEMGCDNSNIYQSFNKDGLSGYSYSNPPSTSRLFYTGQCKPFADTNPPSSIDSPIIVDGKDNIYFGNDYTLYIVGTSVNSNNKLVTNYPKSYALVGKKSNIVILNDSNVVFSNDNDVLCVGNGQAMPTPPPALSQGSGSGSVSSQGVVVSPTLAPGAIGWFLYKAGSPYKLLNNGEMITDPSFTDTDVTAGGQYSYIFTQVDAYDQESAPSDPIYVTFGTPTVTITPTATQTDTNTITPSITSTFTPTNTCTYTSTATQPATPTSTSTATVTMTSTPTISLVLLFKSGDTNLNTNSPHPMFRLVNNDTRAIDLSQIEIRYWYSFEGPVQQETATVDYAGKLPAGAVITNDTHLQIMNGSYGVSQDRYLSVIFDAGADVLASGNYADIDTRFNKTDWSAYNQANDWSYTGATDYVSWNQVAVYYNGVLIWGMAPIYLSPTITQTYTNSPTITTTYTITPTFTETQTYTNISTATYSNTATPTMTGTVTPTITQTYTGTVTTTYTNSITPTATYTYTATYTATPSYSVTRTSTPTITRTFTPTYTATPTNTMSVTLTMSCTPSITTTFTISATPTQGSGSITLMYKSADNNNSTNSPHPQFRLYNNSSSSLDLSTVEIRYWYKFEGTNQTEQATIDSALIMSAGTHIESNTNKTIVTGSFGSQGRYLKITFNSAAGSLSTSSYVEIQSRFNKSDWSNYDQSNDYSYANYSNFTNWNNVTVYINGTLAWGSPPYGASSISKKPAGKAAALAEENVYNYPNPFSGSTTIRFSTDKIEPINMQVFDINGKPVWHTTLEPGQIRLGINYFIWNAQNDLGLEIGNGVYILQISDSTISVIKKIVLIRDK
jgi:hypothetical protein